jgi:hypothetical protein
MLYPNVFDRGQGQKYKVHREALSLSLGTPMPKHCIYYANHYSYVWCLGKSLMVACRNISPIWLNSAPHTIFFAC